MKKSKLIIVSLSLLMLISFCIFNIYKEKNTIFGVETINENLVEKITKNKTNNDSIKIYYNDEVIPNTDSLNDYLLSQSSNDKYIGKLSCDNDFKVKIIKNNLTKEELMKSNTPLQAIIYSKNEYKIINIIMTNLPVISIKDNRYEYYNFDDGSEYQLAYADMILYDPIVNGGDFVDIVKSNCKYRIRGATSRVYPKQSFKLNLLDKNGGSKNNSLLNMRKDNDWILNAMYIDESKVKEYIGYDIWNNLNHNSTPNVQYVEVIINDSYRGLYLLQSPVDHKTFNSKKNKDILFSVNNRGYEVEERYLYNDDVDFDNETIVDEFELEKSEYVDNRTGFELARKLYSDIFDYGYESIYNIEYNLENFAKYAILLNTIEATDNSYKNQKIMFKQKSKYNYIFEKQVWDLDVSMLDDSYGEIGINDIIEDVLLPSVVKNDPKYMDLQKYYYNKARKTYYSKSYMNDLIDKLNEYLKCGSAIERDAIRWGNDRYDESLLMVRNFFEKRIDVLDRYYGGDR